MEKTFDKYRAYMKEISHLRSVMSLLSWDQEVNMPENGAVARAEQMAMMSKLYHQRMTNDNFYELLDYLHEQPSLSEFERKNVALTLEDVRKIRKYPESFVTELTHHTSLSYHYWHKAKTEKNFEIFAPYLEKMIALKKQEAEILGYRNTPYDALLNEYDRGLNTEILNKIFTEVKEHLVPFIHHILPYMKDFSFVFRQSYDKSRQWNFVLRMLRTMGFDFHSGRQDISAHPFSIRIAAGDVRITTKNEENDLSEIIWSSIHEAGHALYELGLSSQWEGMPAAEAASLSIHESQSRIWENNVGRGIAFWKYFFPWLQQEFPSQLTDHTLETFYTAMNSVKCSPIRIQADELTYHLHILIRYEIEKEIFENNLSVNQLPTVWNEKYRQYLGIEVQHEAEGILQDVHWSHGSFGYFPTYSLGSFYAAQFYAKAAIDIPELEIQISQGNFQSLLQWLRDHIHIHGRMLTSEEICRNATGEGLNFRYFFTYVSDKYESLIKKISV